MSNSVSERPAAPPLRYKLVTLLLMLVAPLAIEAAWLYLSRTSGFPPNIGSADTFGLGVSIVAGSLAMFRMRLSLVARLCFLVAYIVTSALILAFFDLVFVCTAFQQCP